MRAMKMIPGLLMLLLLMTVSTGQAAIFNTSFGFDIWGTYDDNILLQSEEEIDADDMNPEDRILQIHPYVQIVTEGVRSSMTLKYQYFREWYDIAHALDRTDNSFHDGSLKAKWDVTDNITLELNETYVDSLYGMERTEVPEIRDDYISNQLVPALKWHNQDKLTIQGSVFWNLQDYDEEPIYVGGNMIGYADWEELGGNLTAELQLLTRTSFFVSGEIWNRDYDNETVAFYSDVGGYSIDAGINQKLGEGINLKAYARLSHRQYDESFADDDTYDHLGGFIEYSNQFTAISKLTITGFSRFVGSERVSNAFYRDTGIQAEFFTLFGKHIEAAAKGQYSSYRYDNVEDPWTDDFYKGAVTLGYRFKEWLSIRGQYQYAVRNSDHEYDDFENNLFSIYLHFFVDFYR